MGLKEELQLLTEKEIINVNGSLQTRLNTVTPDEFVAETCASIDRYPAINKIAQLVFEQAVLEGLSVERAVHRSVGASQAIFVLTTIAEVKSLPPVGN
jgi:hypothetical protein